MAGGINSKRSHNGRQAHVKKLKIVMRDPTGLKAWERNSRTHSEAQVQQIMASIERFGFNDPIAITSKGTVIAGAGRLEAATRLGLARIPCLELDHLDQSEWRAYLIAHNKTSDNAGWDQDLLLAELRELSEAGIDMALLGLTPDEIAAALAPDRVEEGKTDPDDAPEVEHPISLPGDVWHCGRHRVVCGTATDAKALEHALKGGQADLVWTDPPYNVDIEGGTAEHLKIQNDHLEQTEFQELLEAAFQTMDGAMKQGAVFYIAYADTNVEQFRGALRTTNLAPKQGLVWVKNSAPLSRQDYNWQHEPILYGWKQGKAHYFCRDFTLTTVLEDLPAEYSKLKKADLVAILDRLKDATKPTVLHFDRPTKSPEHPTMKPVAMVRQLIENSSRPGQAVLDPFGGSGSTLIACEQAARTAGIVGIDPRYVDVTVRRWERFTGSAAKLKGKSYKQVQAARTRPAKGKKKASRN